MVIRLFIRDPRPQTQNRNMNLVKINIGPVILLHLLRTDLPLGLITANKCDTTIIQNSLTFQTR